VTAATAGASEGKNVWLEQDLDDNLYGELTGGKTGGDGHTNVLTIVERAAFFESCIVQGPIGVRLRPA